MSADGCKVCGVDARTVRLSSLLCVLYVGACAFFVRHLKCIKVISFQVFVPVQLYVSYQKKFGTEFKLPYSLGNTDPG